MKKGNLGLKKTNETIPEDGRNTVFSWNFNQKKMDLEDGINLHKKIDFSCESLWEFKRWVGDNIFDALDGNFKSKEKLKNLRYYTVIQKKINNNKREIDRVLLKFQKKREKENSKKSGIELIKAIQEINDQEKKELDQIGISIDDLEKIQIDLWEQEKFLAVASVLKSSSDNVWKTLLSMPENEAPWVKLNVSWQSYEIKKWEECKDKDAKWCIKQVIEDKVISDEKYDDNYVDFVLSFLLNPFNLWEKTGERTEKIEESGENTEKSGENTEESVKCDEETLKYYVYSIIDCVENTDIVQEIWKLYEKKKEAEEKVRELQSDMSKFIYNVQWLQKRYTSNSTEEHKDNIGGKTGENMDDVKEETGKKVDFFNLENYILVEYLKYLEDNSDAIKEDFKISDETVKRYNEIIKHFIGISATESLVEKCNSKNKVEDLDIKINLEDKDSFLGWLKDFSKKIWSDWTYEREEWAKRFWYLIKNDLLWLKSLCKNEHYLNDRDIDLLRDMELYMDLHNKKYLTENMKNFIRDFESDERKDRANRLRNSLKNMKISGKLVLDEGIRKKTMNMYFSKILWIQLNSSILNDMSAKKADRNLVNVAISRLIEQVNKERKTDYEVQVLSRIYKDMMSKPMIEVDILTKMEEDIVSLVKDVEKYTIDEDGIKFYDGKIEKYREKIEGFSSSLESCVTLEDYKKLIWEMGVKLDGRDTLQWEIRKYSNDVEAQKNELEWYYEWRDKPLDEVPEWVDLNVDIVRMVAIKRILEVSDWNFSLKDKLYYITSLKNQSKLPFSFESVDEKHENVIRDIFGGDLNNEDVSDDDVRNFISNFDGRNKEEIERMRKLFPKALKSYVGKNNTETLNLNFCEIQMWILKNALNNWKDKKWKLWELQIILEYMWITFWDEWYNGWFPDYTSDKIINGTRDNYGPIVSWTLNFMLFLVWNMSSSGKKQWCFSQDGDKKINLNNASWLMNFKTWNTERGIKFSVWWNRQFRLYGYYHDGRIEIIGFTKYHDKNWNYDDFLDS